MEPHLDRNSPGEGNEETFTSPLNAADLELPDSEHVDPDEIRTYLASLDKWADDMRARSDAEAETLSRIYESRLPVALFHATTQERAQQIMTGGLQPSRLMFDDDEVVSLSDSIEYAKFCASQTQEVDPDELVVLEVTTEGLERQKAKSYLLMDNPVVPGEKLHEVHYGDVIGRDWLYQLSPAEAAEIERTEK